MNYALTKKSSNAKTGAIPVSTSHKDTCPDSCPLKDNGCYASSGYYTNHHWTKVTEGARGTGWFDFLKAIESLPAGVLWRHNVAGDLRGEDDTIDAEAARQLVVANGDRRGFTYTHYPMTPVNANTVGNMNSSHFTVNVSTNSASEALQVKREYPQLPVVTIVTEDFWRDRSSVKASIGSKDTSLVRRPAETSDTVNCKSCQLCSHSHRESIVAFTVHGSQKAKAADVIASTGA